MENFGEILFTVMAIVGSSILLLGLIGVFGRNKIRVIGLGLSIGSLGFMGLGLSYFFTKQETLIGVLLNTIGIAMALGVKKIMKLHEDVWTDEGEYCEVCGRLIQDLGSGMPPYINLPGVVFFVTKNMLQGTEGPGDECQRCGRIYCWKCAMPDMTCKCGSKNFRTVRLRYR
jgi:hypothetical protein